MRSRRARLAVRTLVMTGAVALVGASPGVAQAATEYDGDATALRIEGLQLKLFPNGTDRVPAELKPVVDALKELQAQAPEELQRDSLTLAMPDQVIGQAEYPGTDTQGQIPPNPLITADVLEAQSVNSKNGGMVSEASVAGLSLGGGVLSADVIKTSCVGTGEKVGVDVSQVELTSNQDIVNAEVGLKPGTAVPIEGLGRITFNEQDTDGTTYGEGTNVVIDLDSDLSLAALARVFDTTAPAVERALKEVLVDLGKTKLGPDKEQPLLPLLNEENVEQLQGQQVYDGLDQGLDELEKQAPPELANALNNVAHFAGTVTVSNAACAQATTSEAASPQPQEPPEAVPADPVSDSEPPLADTGSPAGIAGIGGAGLLALVGGGLALVRLRRREG